MAEISLETFDMPGGGPGADETRIGGTVWVSSLGNDATGERNNVSRHFLTIPAAVSAALAGDVIMIAPGAYSVPSNIAKDDVVYQTLGVVAITYTGASYLFDTTGFTAGITIDGNFVFINTPSSSGVLNINDEHTRNLRFQQIECYGGSALIFANGTAARDCNIQGHVYSEAAPLAALSFYASNLNVIYTGNITVASDIQGVTVGGAGGSNRVLIRGNIQKTVNGASALVLIGTAQGVTIDGTVFVPDGYSDEALTVASGGGDVVVNGQIRGLVRDNTNTVNALQINNLLLNGAVYGNIYAEGYANTTINGELHGVVVVNSGNARVTQYGNFGPSSFPTFNVSDGVYIFYGDNNRTESQAGVCTGGEVCLLGRYITKCGPTLGYNGMIGLDGGLLRLSAIMQNTSTEVGASCVDFVNGKLILQGVSMYVASGYNPCILTETSVNPVKVYGAVENSESSTARTQIDELIITSNASALYEVEVDGIPYSYTPSPGDSTAVIAAGLAAAILSASVVQPVVAVGSSIALTAVVAGTGYTLLVTAGAISVNSVQLNNSGLTNYITGTTIITDSEVE